VGSGEWGVGSGELKSDTNIGSVIFMAYKTLPLVDLKPDLRSAKNKGMQRGIAVKLLRIITLIFLDAISLTLALRLALFYGTPLKYSWTADSSFAVLTFSVELGTIAMLGLYKAGQNRRNYGGLAKAISLSSLLLLLIAFLYEPNLYISRSAFLLFWASSIAFIFTSRFLFDMATKLVRRKGVVLHPVFLISDVEDKEANISFIQRTKCYKIRGIGDASSLDKSNREATFDYLHKRRIEEAFVSWNAIKNRLYISWYFYTAGITLRIIPVQTEVIPPNFEFSLVGELPCMTIQSPIITGSDFWLKRGLDLFCSTILLLLFSPLYLLIALLIKLDSPGPIFFKQDRIGLHGKKFKIWKFRTMVTNAEKLQAVLEAKNETKDGVLFKLKDDPRITKVGKFLRRYSLDELPQIFNILLGDMSLVGPRPLPVRDVQRFKATHFIRQEVLPGITGLWQVSGRSDIDDFEDVIQLDLSYIQNWSLLLDLQILLKTVKVVLQKTGAY
jgi:exopolysaccharide biosynthesis polyprenyl glycosylphosphotransferase